jgi:DNA-binding transcriptional regulator YiaG
MNKPKNPKDKASAAFKAGLSEAVAYAQGRKARVKVETLHVRTTGEDIKEARQILNVSQPQFARLMVVSSETVKKWEQNKNPIPASVGYWVVGLKIHPETTKELLLEMAGRLGVRSGHASAHQELHGALAAR